MVSLGLESSGIPPEWGAAPDRPGVNLWCLPFGRVGPFRDDLAPGFLADVDAGSGALSALRVLPFRRRRRRLDRRLDLEWCGEADRAAMAALLDEQGRALGTGCRASDDGVLTLIW